MRFKSRKGILFNAIILGLCAFLAGITLFNVVDKQIGVDESWVLIPVFIVVGFLVWMWYGTYYELTDTELIYGSGPFARKISLDRIKEIAVQKTIWIGNWPTTARKGLVIKYDTHGLLNISPKTNESFIKKILELNSEIKITE
ncbi:PH domain-containing protein [Flagellimonas sp.]|uniref:PH domain-containing protein n=1 Tax=Flagellimonas sp. TaxID=2058762 RepID=UPI003B5CF414